MPVRADLHGMTLSHATSLRQAYNMTQDHLHVHNIFTYKIKHAKVCTVIFRAKVQQMINKYFSCPALKKKLSR